MQKVPTDPSETNRCGVFEYQDVPGSSKAGIRMGMIVAIPQLTRMNEAELERHFRENFPSSHPAPPESALEEQRNSNNEGPTDVAHESRGSGESIAGVCHECGKAEARGRAEGFEIGMSTTREECQQWMDAERMKVESQLEQLLNSFETIRVSYLQRFETETVSLALAIAERVLHREAQADRLLLSNSVRVALSQLAGSIHIRLRVPASDQSLWEKHVASFTRENGVPVIVPDDFMSTGECRLETDFGSADLGILSQLEAIAHGIADESSPLEGGGDGQGRSPFVNWQKNSPPHAPLLSPAADVETNPYLDLRRVQEFAEATHEPAG